MAQELDGLDLRLRRLAKMRKRAELRITNASTDAMTKAVAADRSMETQLKDQITSLLASLRVVRDRRRQHEADLDNVDAIIEKANLELAMIAKEEAELKQALKLERLLRDNRSKLGLTVEQMRAASKALHDV